jgi:hypothetical protein
MSYQQEMYKKRKHWEQIVSDFNSSGLTKTEFCKKNNLIIHNLQYWCDKFKRNKTPSDKSIKSSPVIEVVNSSYLFQPEKSKLPDPKWLAKLIVALNEVN